MAKRAIPTWCFVLAVVRLGHRILLVHEKKHRGWYLPAGRVEPGEDFISAAIRETKEESGIDIHVEGVLRVEHSPQPGGEARLRLVVVARPKGDTPPRKKPNEHTLEAGWFSLEEMDALELRGKEVRQMMLALDQGAAVYPRSIFTFEGAPWSAALDDFDPS